jgi:hypothetical protein
MGWRTPWEGLCQSWQRRSRGRIARLQAEGTHVSAGADSLAPDSTALLLGVVGDDPCWRSTPDPPPPFLGLESCGDESARRHNAVSELGDRRGDRQGPLADQPAVLSDPCSSDP